MCDNNSMMKQEQQQQHPFFSSSSSMNTETRPQHLNSLFGRHESTVLSPEHSRRPMPPKEALTLDDIERMSLY